VLHTRALAERLREMNANVTANCVHPGIVRTRLIRDRDGLVTSAPSSLIDPFASFSPSREYSREPCIICSFNTNLNSDKMHGSMVTADTVFFLASKLLKTIPQVSSVHQLT